MRDVRIDFRVEVAKQLGVVLTGKLAGRRDFAKVCDMVASLSPGGVVLLDFANVEYVSGSWIAWMLIPFISFAAEEKNDLYLLIANIPQSSADDFQLIAEKEHSPLLLLSQGNSPQATVIGTLDAAQLSTLNKVQGREEVTGAGLANDAVRATAWNNRLRDLNLKRLLRRRRSGREQFYSKLIGEVKYNG